MIPKYPILPIKANGNGLLYNPEFLRDLRPPHEYALLALSDKTLVYAHGHAAIAAPLCAPILKRANNTTRSLQYEI